MSQVQLSSVRSVCVCVRFAVAWCGVWYLSCAKVYDAVRGITALRDPDLVYVYVCDVCVCVRITCFSVRHSSVASIRSISEPPPHHSTRSHRSLFYTSQSSGNVWVCVLGLYVCLYVCICRYAYLLTATVVIDDISASGSERPTQIVFRALYVALCVQ